MSGVRRACVAAPVVMSVLLVHIASAQDAALPEEVLVTATRRATTVDSYAGSATRIDARAIALVGATHLSQTLNRAPGAYFQRNSGQESLSAIRSPVLSGPGSCASFLFLEDSVPIRPVGFCNVNQLFEVDGEQADAIEVLRGPAGALYGSSAMHGAVNVLSPRLAKLPALSVAVERGPEDYYRARAATRFEGANTSVGLSGLAEYDGGWRDDSLTRQQKLTAALEQQLDGDSRFDLRLSATRLDQNTAGFIQGFESYRDSAIARSNSNPEAFRTARALRLNGHYELPIASGWQLDVRPYLRSSRMEFLQHFLVGKPLENNGQDSGGVLGSMHFSSSRTDLTFGAEAELAHSSLFELQRGPATDGAPAANTIRPVGRHYDYTVDSRVLAGYVRVEQQLTGSLTAEAGGRFERVDYDYDNRMLAGNTADSGSVCPGGCLFNRPSDRRDYFNSFTPRVGLNRKFASHHSVYLTAARGYRAPDTSELYRLQRQQGLATLDPERLDNAEFGLRGRAAALHYTLAAFSMRKDHVILRDSNGFNVSDGRTRHRGIEYEFVLHALNGGKLGKLELTLAGSYARHTYDFNRVIDGGETIVSGRDIDTAPRRVFNARANWQPRDSVTAELEWQHVGQYFVDASNLRSYAGHDLLNLRGDWSFSPAWALAGRLDNLTGRTYADRADFAFGNYRYFPGRRRALFLELRFTQH
ncbi:MAG: TonB-dependent receptor [Steroidobacteraceae bacterium]